MKFNPKYTSLFKTPFHVMDNQRTYYATLLSLLFSSTDKKTSYDYTINWLEGNLENFSISNILYSSWSNNISPRTPNDLETHIQISIKPHFPKWSEAIKKKLPKIPPYLVKTLPHHRKKSFAKTLNKLISTLYRQELLPKPYQQLKSELGVFLLIAGQDLLCPDLFTPAPYINTHSRISTKCLLL